jgi:hypothetical protein
LEKQVTSREKSKGKTLRKRCAQHIKADQKAVQLGSENKVEEHLRTR